MLIEVDDRVLTVGAIAKVAEDGRKVGLFSSQKFDDILNPQFVEVDTALSPTNLKKRLRGISNTTGQCGQSLSQCVGSADDVADTVTKGTGPLGAPGSLIDGLVWPAELLV